MRLNFCAVLSEKLSPSNKFLDRTDFRFTLARFFGVKNLKKLFVTVEPANLKSSHFLKRKEYTANYFV